MIFLYHRVYPDWAPADRWAASPIMRLTDFKRQIQWLKKQYQIVPLDDYVANLRTADSGKRKLAAITFDDGYKVTFECVASFLVDYHVPATFFVTTGHLEHGPLLWSSYLHGLCFDRLHDSVELDQVFPLKSLALARHAWHELSKMAKYSGDPAVFGEGLARQYPLTPALVSEYEGMTHEQVMSAASSGILEIGAHATNHPFLDQMPKEIMEREVREGKAVLSKLSGRPVRFFAYPSGEYDLVTIRTVRAAGYEAAFARKARGLGGHPRFEVGRVSITAPSLLRLQLKTRGVDDLVRRIAQRGSDVVGSARATRLTRD